NAFGGTSVADVLADPTTPRNAIYYGVLTGQTDASGTPDTLYIGPNQRQFVSQGVQTVVRFRAKTGPFQHSVEYGARAHYDSIDRLHTQEGFLVQSGQLTADGRATQTTADNLGWTYAFAMHAADAISWKRTIFTPGVRLEMIRSGLDNRITKENVAGSYQAVLPGVGLYQGLTKDFGLLGGVYRGFSPTAPGQSRTNSPETSVNYEAGARYSSRRLRAEVIGFFNSYSNLTDVCTFSNGCIAETLDRQFDAGRARIYGLEAFAESEVPLGNEFVLPARASYTYTDSEFLNGFNSQDPILGNVVRGDQLPYIPYHQLAVSAGLERRKWAVNASGTFVGTMREVAGQGPAPASELTDSYFLLGASASYRVLSWLKVYATGQNLLNQAYLASRRPYGARPGAPLMLNVGAKAEF
ncbi:MAG: TonB-dependent receptor, partial [Proteobacteria bacterium]